MVGSRCIQGCRVTVAVHRVVQALGDREEVRVTVDDEPADPDAEILDVADQTPCSISATPPPTAVEFTFQMVRPENRCRKLSAPARRRA
ncbi:hypothetical protein AB0368_37285 [Actinoplanes sp. NPDC051475]|uniref:hypothetical protein n=1 Tax=Actinoplanes sp. NPDC051475 TaxID=3157225 RepID=UPI00344B81BB